MSIKFTKLSSILLITAVASLFVLEARAEKPMAQPKSVNTSFNDAYFEHTGDNYKNSSIFGQLNTMFGFAGFPDNQISADGRSVDNLYEDIIKQQSQVGSPVKTRDLQNPYGTSLQENPNYIGY